MLSLGEQIGGGVTGRGGGIGNHQRLGWAGQTLDVNGPVDQPLGLDDEAVAGAGNLIHPRHTGGAVGQRRNRLGTTDGENAINPNEVRGGENRGGGQARGALGRRTDDDLGAPLGWEAQPHQSGCSRRGGRHHRLHAPRR